MCFILSTPHATLAALLLSHLDPAALPLRFPSPSWDAGPSYAMHAGAQLGPNLQARQFSDALPQTRDLRVQALNVLWLMSGCLRSQARIFRL